MGLSASRSCAEGVALLIQTLSRPARNGRPARPDKRQAGGAI